MAVAADHPAEVSAPVISRLLGRLREGPDPEKFAISGQVRPATGALLGPGHVLPATAGEEAVIFTGDQTGAVLQRDPVGGLDRLPVGQHRGGDVPPVRATAHRTVD